MEEDIKKIITTGVAELKEQQRIIEKALKEVKELEAKEAEGTSGLPISQLPSVTSLSNEAIFPLVQDSTTSKATIGSLKGLVLQHAYKLSIQTSYQYFLSEAEYDLSSHIMIDENSKSYLDGEFYQIVIPFSMTKSSSKIVRFTRLNGVKMELDPYSSIGGELMIVPANSIRINIASENSDGSIVEIQDLVYSGESIEIFISYTANKLTDAKLLTHLPILQVNSTMSYDFTNPNTNLTFSVFGVPCSQVFDCYNVTETFEYKDRFYTVLGLAGVNNPFQRSLDLDTSVVWQDFLLPIKNSAGLTTNFVSHPNISYSHILKDASNGLLVTAPLGGHFPRFQQLKDNYVSWDNTTEPDNPVMVTGDVNNMFYSDTTGKHTHGGASTSSYENADAGGNYSIPKGTVTYSNRENTSYETAGRWVGLQAWVYL